MVEFKLVIGSRDGKTFQKQVEGEQAESLLKRRLGENVSGEVLGMPGYEFLITGGADKCGFPLRKGVQAARMRVLVGESVGFSGRKRPLRKGKKHRRQDGLLSRRTVCGEIITKIVRQVNLKVLKEGATPLGGAGAETGAKDAGDAKAEASAKAAA